MRLSRTERVEIKLLAAKAEQLAAAASAALDRRRRVIDAANRAAAELRARVIRVGLSTGGNVDLLVLGETDRQRLRAVAERHALPELESEVAGLLEQIATAVPQLSSHARRATRIWQVLASSERRALEARKLDELRDLTELAKHRSIPGYVDQLSDAEPFAAPDIVDALDPEIGLGIALGWHLEFGFLDSDMLLKLPIARSTLQGVLARAERLRESATTAAKAVREEETDKLVATMAVDRLRDATRERIRIQPLVEAGVLSVLDVFNSYHELAYIRGIGAETAFRIQGAANTIWQSAYEEMPIRIDVNNPSGRAIDLVRHLGAWGRVRKLERDNSALASIDRLSQLAAAIPTQGAAVAVVLGDETARDALAAEIEILIKRAAPFDEQEYGAGLSEPWPDFLARPADYFALLSELGFALEDEKAVVGGLPDEIVAAVQRAELDTERLDVSLRGYQAFAARFALVQRKVLIGDEMGLGKTIEALAVLAHLYKMGSRHSLVICPAAVVTNWMRETSEKSTIPPYRLHGVGRQEGLRSWIKRGGVGVTSFGSLAWLERHLPTSFDVSCVVVDEAHYVKNPWAKRSELAANLIARSERAILLTGTPLENRVEEFANLVGYLRPDLVVHISSFIPRLFREQVAPAYLRRNQEDVLRELPELIEVTDWLPMSPQDEFAYREAVADRSFPAMRQAAMTQGLDSEKMKRLVELVQEAEDNGRKVIVFSYFREVLRQVVAELPGLVFGPLTGSTPAAKRQLVVDDFTAAHPGSVLVAQIQAGGVGLNIQAASVVIITEPQLKPTSEWQAVARARRMGQVHSVQVHRLTSEVGVDQRITEILARKREVFDDFAAISETAKLAPEAVDVSESELVREILTEERQRLFPGVAD